MGNSSSANNTPTSGYNTSSKLKNKQGTSQTGLATKSKSSKNVPAPQQASGQARQGRGEAGGGGGAAAAAEMPLSSSTPSLLTRVASATRKRPSIQLQQNKILPATRDSPASAKSRASRRGAASDKSNICQQIIIVSSPTPPCSGIGLNNKAEGGAGGRGTTRCKRGKQSSDRRAAKVSAGRGNGQRTANSASTCSSVDSVGVVDDETTCESQSELPETPRSNRRQMPPEVASGDSNGPRSVASEQELREQEGEQVYFGEDSFAIRSIAETIKSNQEERAPMELARDSVDNCRGHVSGAEADQTGNEGQVERARSGSGEQVTGIWRENIVGDCGGAFKKNEHQVGAELGEPSDRGPPEFESGQTALGAASELAKCDKQQRKAVVASATAAAPEARLSGSGPSVGKKDNETNYSHYKRRLAAAARGAAGRSPGASTGSGSHRLAALASAVVVLKRSLSLFMPTSESSAPLPAAGQSAHTTPTCKANHHQHHHHHQGQAKLAVSGSSKEAQHKQRTAARSAMEPCLPTYNQWQLLETDQQKRVRNWLDSQPLCVPEMALDRDDELVDGDLVEGGANSSGQTESARAKTSGEANETRATMAPMGTDVQEDIEELKDCAGLINRVSRH